jgi:multidrug efflux pump subunit AcrA (membrane-fusion protein)
MASWKSISIAGLIVLAAGVCAAVYLQPRAAVAPVLMPAQQPSAAAKDLVLQGRAYCSLTMPINTPIAGRVAEVLVQVGQAVKKNDALVKLELLPNDAANLALRANKAPAIHAQELMIQQIELKLSQLERNIEEMQKLTAVNLAPRNALPELLEQKVLALNQLQNAKQTLADIRRAASEDLRVLTDQLGQTVTSGSTPRFLYLRAQLDGHVIGIEPTVTIGATVAGKLCTLGVMDPMVIRGQVHESEIDRLKAGETAHITLDSSKGEPLEAKLTSVSWSAQDSSLAAPSYYLFELTVPNPSLAMRDGNKVQVTFKAMPTGAKAEQAPTPAGPKADAPAPAAQPDKRQAAMSANAAPGAKGQQ